MKTIGAVTVARSDYGIYRPVLRAIEDHPGLQIRLYVTGMHLAPEYGMTVREIEADGFRIEERIEMLMAGDSPESVSRSMGVGTAGFAQAFGRERPDILLVLGDRFEMHAAAVASVPFRVPLAHLHGGELTFGAIDDAFRHSITKLSHLHFVASDMHRKRLEYMGEEPWRITVSGAPGLDTMAGVAPLPPHELTHRFGVTLDPPPVLVTFHPVTLEYEKTGWHVAEMLAALEQVDRPIVFTLPNADTHGHIIADEIRAFVSRRPGACIVESFGAEGYASMLRVAGAMVGNSSSGLIEAPSFGLPVVNIGRRQEGRLRAANVIDAAHGREAVLEAVHLALSPAFRSGLAGLRNPYGDGNASVRIVERLASVPLDERLCIKRFYEPDREE